MKNTLKLGLILLLFSISGLAQDVIIKNDKTEMKTKVLEITDETIKYKKFEALDGPTYNINKSDVFMIIYKNGTKEYIEQKSSKLSAEQKNKKATIDDEDFAFNSKTKGLFLGFGFGSGLTSTGVEITVPPTQLRYEWAVSPNISLGLTAATLVFDIPGFGYNSYYGTTYSTSSEYIYLMFAGRGNYHFATTNKFDPYIGVSLGYNIEVNKGIGSALAGGQVGANYYFSPKFGAWGELGYGIGYINLGVTIKF